MKTACLTVFYSEMEPFAEDFLASVAAQSQSDFDLVVVNDGSHITKQSAEKQSGKRVLWYEYNDSPQINRIFGLRQCEKQGYERIICADADETMDARRMERVVAFMDQHPEAPVVFNNSIARKGDSYFDLFYKEELEWQDLLDFNVLGYGAMNLQGEGIPFVIDLQNPAVLAFDWYVGFIYSLYFGKVYFVKDAFNHYRFHDHNFVGPVFNITADGVRMALDIKANLYSELLTFLGKKGFDEIKDTIKEKLYHYFATMDFIEDNSFKVYLNRLKQELQNAEKLYWWQEGLLL